MTTVPWKSIIKIACLSVIAIPGALTSVQGLTLSPEAVAAMTVISLIAGLTLSEIQPGLTGGVTALAEGDVARIAKAIVEQRQTPQGRG